MPSINLNIVSALNTQRNLSVANTSLSNSISRLSANLRVNTSDAALPQKASNAEAIKAREAIAKTQTDEASLGSANATLNRMTALVQTAAGSVTSAADRDAINQELSDLKGELKNISGSTSSDALSKSYDGGNGASYSLVGAAGSRDISISASTTAEDYAGMLTALNGAQQGVSAARESNSAALSAATQNYTNSVLSSANNSGLAVREIPQTDTSELLARATSARDMLAAGRLAIANAMGSQSMNLATAALRF